MVGAGVLFPKIKNLQARNLDIGSIGRGFLVESRSAFFQDGNSLQ
jgi:hypothetical protein